MDLYHYINNYESDNDCRDNIEMINSEVNDRYIVKNYTIYKIRNKNKEFNDSYVGVTQNFAIQKIQYNSNVKNLKIKTKLIERIRNTGGWNEWEMIELEKMNGKSKDVKIRQQEYIKHHNANLNVRNPVKQNVCKIKNKIKMASDKKKEKLNKMNMRVNKNNENAEERKNQFIEKNKEKRQSQMNKNRELKKFIIEEDNPNVNECLDEYICVLSNEFMDGIVKFEISKTPPNKTSFYKLEFAKKMSNAETKENLIYDILSKERINSNMKLFRVNLQTVKNIFDLMDGEYYSLL